MGKGMIEELLKEWNKYIKFCEKQVKATQKMTERMRRDYDKKYQGIRFSPTSRPLYNPPIVHSIYESPSFNGFMLWLKTKAAQEEEGKTK